MWLAFNSYACLYYSQHLWLWVAVTTKAFFSALNNIFRNRILVDMETSMAARVETVTILQLSLK